MTPELALQSDTTARRPMGEGHLTEEQFGELIAASARKRPLKLRPLKLIYAPASNAPPRSPACVSASRCFARPALPMPTASFAVCRESSSRPAVFCSSRCSNPHTGSLPRPSSWLRFCPCRHCTGTQFSQRKPLRRAHPAPPSELSPTRPCSTTSTARNPPPFQLPCRRSQTPPAALLPPLPALRHSTRLQTKGKTNHDRRIRS